MCPRNIQESLKRYAEQGCPTGDFLRAVLANDLFESFGRADEDNQSAMFAIVSHIYNELPSDCHGSYEIVDEWIDLHTQRRRLAAAVLPNSELPNPEPTP